MSYTAISPVNTVTGTSNQIVIGGTSINPIFAIASNPILPGTGAVTLPEGNTAARAGAAGSIRFNTQLTVFEATPDGSTWYPFVTSSGTVNSVSGTANEITASPTTGAVILTIPSTFVAPGTIAAVTSISGPQYLVTGSGSGTISILPQAAAGTYNLNLPITAGTSGYLLTSAGGGSSPMTWSNITSIAVSSISGTANEITASASTGAVTLSTPSTFIAPGTIAAVTSVSSPSYLLTGSGSGTISILPQAAAGTFNFNLPITAGTSGYFLTSAGGAGSPMTWTNPSSIFTPAALTKTDDANVTLTLGGTPTTALLQATSLTLGWTGTLSATRGGSGVSNPTAHGVLIAEGASAFTPIVLGAGQVLIGTTASDPVAGAIGSGSGILVGNSSGAITVSNTGVLSNVATANQTTVSGATGNVTIGIASNAILPGTGGVTVPTGTTAQRAGSAGTLRYNSQTGFTEFTNDGSTWANISTGAGTVTSVSGTTNRITSTGGSTPVIDISASYVGQSSITLIGTLGQALNMGSNQINAVTDPTSAQDAATKNYVDNVAAGLNPAQSVTAATTGALTVTYSNGVSGIGATLTNAGVQAAFSIDGQTPAITTRVLIKNQASAFQNGVYTVTVPGTGATNWVLTRALDFNQPSDINSTGIIPVINGTVNANTAWLCTSTVTTVGTDAITFTQFGVSYPVSLANGGTGASLTASNGGIFYSTASAGAILAGTATANQVLLSGSSTTPAWSTATYPATTTVNQLLYSSSANVIAGLATANSSILVTSAGGIPSLSTTLPFTLPVTTGGTGDTSFTAYSVICGGTTSTAALQNVSGVGTSGQVLTSNGAAAFPTWQAGGGGGVNGALVYITSQTASSSASLAFVGNFSSSYQQYVFVFNSVLPASNGVTFQCQIGTGGTPTYIAANYKWAVFGGEGDGGYQNTANTSDTAAQISAPAGRTNALVDNALGGICGSLSLYGCNGSSVVTQATGSISFISSDGTTPINEFNTFYQPAATITAIKFIFSSGNIASGTISMYGVSQTTSGGPGVLTWVDQSSTPVTVTPGTGYYTDSGSLVTLNIPATVAAGSTIAVAGKGSGGWLVQMNTGQTANLGSSATSSGGSLASTNQYDSIELLCVTANTTFVVRSAVGNITLA